MKYFMHFAMPFISGVVYCIHLYTYILVTEFLNVIFQYVLTELIRYFAETIGQFLLCSL